MDLCLDVVVPDRCVLKGGIDRVQEQAHGHPCPFPYPEHICHCVRIETQLVQKSHRYLTFIGLKVPRVLEESGPYIIVFTLVYVPQLMDVGL